MGSLRAYLRQHHVGLLAILLILSGGTAYAVTAPKNSVVSTSIKNGAVKTSDIKNGTIRGADIRSGTIEAEDLAGDATTDFNLILTSLPAGGPAVTLWEDPNIGKVTISCNADFRGLSSFGSLSVSPGSVGVQGLELYGENAADTNRLIGAATVTRTSTGQPVGGAGFGGSEASMVHLKFHYVTPTKRVLIEFDFFLCSLRGGIYVDHVVEDSTPPMPPTPARKNSCVATGDAYCGKQAKTA
ncbi:hypothetical protein [Nocardioides dilutus]